MRNHIEVSSAVILGCATVLVLACAIGTPQGMGKVRIQCIVPGDLTEASVKSATPRLIGPPSGWIMASYRLTFAADNGEVITKTLNKESGEVALKVGEWACLAEGLAADGSVIVEKQVHVVADAGKTISLPIALHLANGKGSLQIVFSPSQAPSADWKYSISLVYKGLPGDASFKGPDDFSTELPSTETNLDLADLESGYYGLSVQLKDNSSTTIAGTTTTVLILPKQTSSGECRISLSDPSIDISIVAPNLELSAHAAIGVDRYLNRNKPMIVPLALSQSEADLNVAWYANGGKVEGVQDALSQNLPGFRILWGANELLGMQTLIKMDAMLTQPCCGLSQTLAHTSCISFGPTTDYAEWIQSIDYHAATGSSVFDSADASNTGTGVQADTKWVAASPTGLIAVAGMDKTSALHLFYSPFGREEMQGSGAASPISSSAGWLRLWRDKVVVDKSERSPDRVSISPDGAFIALGASTSNWLGLYSLDSAGGILSKTGIVSTKNGAPEFANIKAIKFSTDSKRLFILTNSPEKILVFNADRLASGETSSEDEFSFESCFETPPSSSLGMEDLLLLSDGWIAACCSNIARIFFVRYSETEDQFSSAELYASGASGESLGDPKSIALDEESGLCYVLGYSKKLHIFSKSDASSDYVPLSTLSLPCEFDKARSLVFLKDYNDAKFLIAGGGSSLGIIALDSLGQPLAFSSLAPAAEDYSGISSISNIVPLGSSIIAAGSVSGLVAMFDIL
jgi:hypothetical protein